MPSMMKAPHSKGANCPMCDGGACKYALGGDVKYGSPEHTKGVHREETGSPNGGTSTTGRMVRLSKDKSIDKHSRGMSGLAAKFNHQDVQEEMKSMPKPTSGRSGFAEGGDVEADDDHDGDDMDTELSHGLGKELMSAFESKDHKKLMSSLEACVLHCMSKGDDDV